MSQEEKAETKIVTTKVEVTMRQILQSSTVTLSSGEDAGKNIIARNLSCMKKWSADNISKIFNDEGNLKSFSRKYVRKQRRSSMTADNPVSRVDMVKSTRKHTIAALKLVFKDEQLRNSEFEMPSKLDLKRMANELISEENIRNKFEKSFIEYDRVRHY